jgi:hypothetical protein
MAACPTHETTTCEPFQRIVMVCAYDEGDACVRLQSGAVTRGLAGRPDVDCHFHKPGAPGFGPQAVDCLGFHYKDLEAIAFLRAHRHLTPGAVVACFGADIYAYRRYAELWDIADFFVMPTEMHKGVLAAQFEVPVYSLPQPVDPVALGPEADEDFPLKDGHQLGWFGYPESFYKGMLTLMPVLRRHLLAGNLDSFTLLTDPLRFANDWNLPLKPYSSNTFRSDLRHFDYVLLSHFPLDLHINSLVKSPNKAITALVAGTIPIATATPAYQALLSQLGLERFLFESPRHLDAFLRRLDPAADSRTIRDSGAVHVLKARYSDEKTGQGFLGLLERYRSEATQSTPPEPHAAPLTLEQFSVDRLRLNSRLGRAIRNRFPGRS